MAYDARWKQVYADAFRSGFVHFTHIFGAKLVNGEPSISSDL